MAEAPRVVPVAGVPRHYTWGSASAIPRLLGQPGDGRPVAELWFGAHEDDPSPTGAGGPALDEVVAADPVGWLGADAAAAYGGRLPFLVKLLAAAMPLSIQVHPNRAQAQSGFDAEQARGVPRDAPQRNYRDRNHKPELLCALTPFEALCGFRPVEATLALLDDLALPELHEVRALLSGQDGLRAAFVHLLSLPEPAALVEAVAARCADVGSEGPLGGPASAVRRAGAAFPGDVGVVVSLLLNHVRLEPGEAIFLGAGNMHCYLHGLGVEVMANSDNVLRCGLTPKHVDVAEVLAVTDFTALAEPRCALRDAGAETSFDVPVPDFAVSMLELADYDGSAAIGRHGPYLVLCTSGGTRVQVAGESVPVRPGEAAFVASRESAFQVKGAGQIFLTTVGGVGKSGF
jgi:mannose-6-phosphate isomerase